MKKTAAILTTHLWPYTVNLIMFYLCYKLNYCVYFLQPCYHWEKTAFMMINVRLQIMSQNVCTIPSKTIKYVPVLEVMLSVVLDALQVHLHGYFFVKIYVKLSYA